MRKRKHKCPCCATTCSTQARLLDHVVRYHLDVSDQDKDIAWCWCGRMLWLRYRHEPTIEGHFRHHGGVEKHYLEVALGVNDA